MEKQNGNPGTPGERLHESLQSLIGLHRQLYELVKTEHEAITQADAKGTYEAVANKEVLIHWIQQAELERQAVTHELGEAEKLDAVDASSLKQIIIHFGSRNAVLADRLQADLNALIILVERIKKQNDLNGRLVGESLKHIHNMKTNIFGETTHQAKTYNQQGQRNQSATHGHGPRLVSKEV